MTNHVGDVICGASSSLLASLVLIVISQAPQFTPAQLEALNRQEAGEILPIDFHSLPPRPTPPPPPPLPTDKPTLERIHASIIDRSPLAAHSAMLRAQVQVESSYDCNARSSVGAVGCAQFMPRTWDDVAPKVDCDGVSRTDAHCAFKGQVSYMEDQMAWVRGADIDSAYASYNEGIGNFRKRQNACKLIPGCNPVQWLGSLENVTGLKSHRATEETRRYVGAIHVAAKMFPGRGTSVEAGFSLSF